MKSAIILTKEQSFIGKNSAIFPRGYLVLCLRNNLNNYGELTSAVDHPLPPPFPKGSLWEKMEGEVLGQITILRAVQINQLISETVHWNGDCFAKKRLAKTV
jgi:hypothetical protein